ncbi:uncharacterized protein LOC120909984 [Rana temporaria]|uniref:uncharacterized protein LOC120909984 n=1 Tax=Rana temporaria TaxID=8407 RepID=UPI001AAD7C45|nr:uncharacterized protein LOC120909984 [Rana temporaria]
MPTCFINSCSSNHRTTNVKLYSFPRNQERIRKWLQKIQIPRHDLESFVETISINKNSKFKICSKHFNETDFQQKGPKRHLKITAYPSLLLKKPPIKSHLELEHNYSKCGRTETDMSSESSTNVFDDSYASNQTSTESVPELQNKSGGSSTAVSDIEMVMLECVDFTLLDSLISTSVDNEPRNCIDLSANEVEIETMENLDSHSKEMKIKPRYKIVHRGIQTNPKWNVKKKGIQACITLSTVSVGSQCSLVELPELTPLPTSQSPMFEVSDIEESDEDILQSPFSDNFTSQAISAVENFKKIDVPAVHHHPNVLVLGSSPIKSTVQETPMLHEIENTDLDISIAPQKKKKDKDHSHRPSPEEEDDIFSDGSNEENISSEVREKDLSYLGVYNLKEAGNVANQNKFLVFEECLDQLLVQSHCSKVPNCPGRIIGLKKVIKGSALIVYAECSQHHQFELWRSQPFVGKMPAGNLLISSAIVSSGSNFVRVKNFFSILKMHGISATTHCSNQRNFIFPTIEHHWLNERTKNIQKIAEKSVALIGDGQCDSPGFNAKYCTYTFMDAETDKIIDFQVEQLQAGRTSVSLEKIAFVKALERVLSDGVNVKIIATDRHVSIRKIIREKYPEIRHEFDVWHVAKSIEGKLMAESKKSTGRKLAGWVPLVKNHLCWSSSTCQLNTLLLKEKWLSINFHASNLHEWHGNSLYHHCSHKPIPTDEEREYEWLTQGSTAHHKLKSIIEDPRLLKDLEHLSGFYHTGELEVFHSMVLKYRSKWQHFSMDGMVARTQLAALDHNSNINRLQAVIQKPKKNTEEKGALRYRYGFSKAKKDWNVGKMYEPTSQAFMLEIICDVVDHAAGIKAFAWHSRQVKDLENIAAFPRPPKHELLSK